MIALGKNGDDTNEAGKNTAELNTNDAKPTRLRPGCWLYSQKIELSVFVSGCKSENLVDKLVACEVG